MYLLWSTCSPEKNCARYARIRAKNDCLLYDHSTIHPLQQACSYPWCHGSFAPNHCRNILALDKVANQADWQIDPLFEAALQQQLTEVLLN